MTACLLDTRDRPVHIHSITVIYVPSALIIWTSIDRATEAGKDKREIVEWVGGKSNVRQRERGFRAHPQVSRVEFSSLGTELPHTT